MSGRIEIEINALLSDKDHIVSLIEGIRKEVESLQEGTVTLAALWKGPASTAYQSRVAADAKKALELCKEMEIYIACMEYASREYVQCEQTVGEIVCRVF